MLTVADGIKHERDARMNPAITRNRETRLVPSVEQSSSQNRFIYHSEPSVPEKKMRTILDSLDLNYEYQLPVRSGFVLDFAFPQKNKAIEVDGFWHQFTQERDTFRDSILQRGGWTVLRLKAEEIEDADAARKRVLEFLKV